MRTRVGVVSRFNAWAPEEHPFRSAFQHAGLEYVPLRLGDIRLRASTKAGTTLDILPRIDGANPDELDVDAVLWRVSENHFLRCRSLIQVLAERCEVINSLDCMDLCGDKWRTQEEMARRGLPTVPTQLLLPDSVVPDMGTERTVIKPSFGAGGRGIRAVNPGQSVELDEAYIAQPEIEFSASRHVRVLVCGGTPLVAIHRIPRAGRGAADEVAVNNLSAGGTAAPAALSPVADIAAAAAQAVGGLFVGVDLVPDEGRGHLILEVNSSPGLEGVNAHSAANVYHLVANEIVHRLGRSTGHGGQLLR